MWYAHTSLNGDETLNLQSMQPHELSNPPCIDRDREIGVCVDVLHEDLCDCVADVLLQNANPECVALRYVALRCAVLRCVALRCVALRCGAYAARGAGRDR